ncbi:MAG: SpoIID/LytB domain-containing protein [bacterium]
MQVPHADAAVRQNYAAEVTATAHPKITIQTGQAITFWVNFRNTGTATWKNTGKNFVALNVTDPSGRVSVFRYRTWKYPYRPARLSTAMVKPGETGRVRFVLQAPKTPGDYTESFQLVAENLTWITGSSIAVPIHVIPPPPAYQAQLVGQAYADVALKPGGAITVWADFKNTGTATWKNTGKHFVALNVTDPSGRVSAFQYRTWKYPYRPARLMTASVKPGDIGRVRFVLQAPPTTGTYVESFQLVAENLTWISGSTISLPITVSTPVLQTSEGEPILDVGLRTVTEPVVLRANGAMNIEKDGAIATTIAQETNVTFSYADGTYTVQLPTAILTSTTPFIAVPGSVDTILEVVNFDNRPSWNPDLNDNRFRGNLRIEYSAVTQKLWLINQLPLESYLRGLAEGGNTSPPEFLKALIVAARTYAHYHFLTKTKHADEHFTIDATNDQVYRGYGFEIRSPNVTQAVVDTRGMEVTYGNVIVITPYYSQSDGRTRSWEEVWSGGPYPWLVSVPDPTCAGLPLLGHGVGMSARGAVNMANAGKTFQEILAYYYTGISVLPQY